MGWANSERLSDLGKWQIGRHNPELTIEMLRGPVQRFAAKYSLLFLKRKESPLAWMVLILSVTPWDLTSFQCMPVLIKMVRDSFYCLQSESPTNTHGMAASQNMGKFRSSARAISDNCPWDGNRTKSKAYRKKPMVGVNWRNFKKERKKKKSGVVIVEECHRKPDHKHA